MRSRDSGKARWGAENNGIVQDEKERSHKKGGGGKKRKGEKKGKRPRVYRGAFGE